MFEACATYNLAGGTRRLVQAMFEDGHADLRLESIMALIRHDEDVAGEHHPFVALAPSTSPLTLAQVEHVGDGETLVVMFGWDASLLDGTDRQAVQDALAQWIPDVQVITTASHGWVADPLSRENWPMLRTHQLTGSLEEPQHPEDRVVLAGSDYANGWMGFIDGVIESGMRAARIVSADAAGEALS